MATSYNQIVIRAWLTYMYTYVCVNLYLYIKVNKFNLEVLSITIFDNSAKYGKFIRCYKI